MNQTIYTFTPPQPGKPGTVTARIEDDDWPKDARHARFDRVDLGDGVHAVLLDPAVRNCSPPAYIAEVFLAEGSHGDGVIYLTETADGSLIATDPAELAEIRRKAPNVHGD